MWWSFWSTRENGVEAGQPLARLDVSTLEVKRRQLEAQRLQAAAVLAELRAGPRTETIAAARASVEQREAELELWKRTLHAQRASA